MPSTGRWRLWTAVSPHGHKLHVVCSLLLSEVQTDEQMVQSEPHFGFYASVLATAAEGGAASRHPASITYPHIGISPQTAASVGL